MLTASDTQSLVHGVSRTLVLRHAKRGLEEVIYAANPQIRIVQQELPEHKTLQWPIGAIDIIRMSIIGSDGTLTPIYVNNQNPIAYEYLRDGSGNIIPDVITGNPIKSVASTAPLNSIFTDNEALYSMYNYSYGRKYGLRGGESAGGGQYRYDRDSGRIHFFHLDDGTNILFEYIANPLVEQPEANLEIHEYSRDALDSYIYYHIIHRRENVPANEKERARREYFHTLKRAKKRTLINPSEVLQAFKKSRAILSW